MTALLTISLLAIYLLPLALAFESAEGNYTTTILYETVYPVEIVYITDSSQLQCSSLSLPMCNELTWSTTSGYLSAPATTAALLLPPEDWITVTSTYFQNAGTTTKTITNSNINDGFGLLESASLLTELNVVTTNNKPVVDSGSDIRTTHSISDIDSNQTDSLRASSTRDTDGGIQTTSSSTDTLVSASITTTTTQDHRSPFILERTGSTDFMQYGPEDSMILGPLILDRTRAAPPIFILPHHGYLVSGNDPDDVVFLRLIGSNKTAYYQVAHGPKRNISFKDLTSRFRLEGGYLSFFEQGQNTSSFEWYVAIDTDSISRLFMAPTQAAVPEYFSRIELSKKNSNKPLPENLLTSTTSLSSGYSPLSLQTPTFVSATTVSQAITITTRSRIRLISSSETAGNFRSKTNASTPRLPARPTKCPSTPDPAQVWQLRKSISRLYLQSYCSNLLRYDALSTLTKTSARSTIISNIYVTTVDETETETETKFTKTITIAISTEYDAGDGKETDNTKKRRERIDSDLSYPVIDKSSYDGVYGTSGDILTQVATFPQTISEPLPKHTIPVQLFPFCDIDIIEACFQAVPADEPTTVTQTQGLDTITFSLTEALTETEIKTVLAASTTTLLNTTQISYPGTGRMIVDSGAYQFWYLYWSGNAFDSSLYLRLPPRDVDSFAAEYRPNMDTYRVYTTASDGEKYYMSISVPFGISPVTDYSVSLRTLNDINSDEGSVLLYLIFDWNTGYMSVDVKATETYRDTMFGCTMIVNGELKAQVRLYALGDGTVPRECQAWSNLILTS